MAGKKAGIEYYSEIFGREFSAEHREFVNEAFPKVFSDTVRRVAGKCSMDKAVLEDLAVNAAIYALRAFVEGKCPWPKTVSDWTNMSVLKAGNLAKDLFASGKRTPMVYLDEAPVEADGELMVESRVAVEASLQSWRDRQVEAERRTRNAAVRYAVPKVVAEMRTRDPIRTLRIVKAAYFTDMPVSEICQRFEGLNSNSFYQLLFRFRDCFSKCGTRYMDEYMDCYSDAVYVVV